MARLSQDNDSDSDSDVLPAVEMVLQGSHIDQVKREISGASCSIAGNGHNASSISGNRIGESSGQSAHRKDDEEWRVKCDNVTKKGIEEHTVFSSPRKERNYKSRHILEDEADEEGYDELESKKDRNNLLATVVARQGLLVNGVRHNEQKQFIRPECGREVQRPAGQQWEIALNVNVSRKDEGIPLSGNGIPKTLFTRTKLPMNEMISKDNVDNNGNASIYSVRPSQIIPGRHGCLLSSKISDLVDDKYRPDEAPKTNSQTGSISDSPMEREGRKRTQKVSISTLRESTDSFWRESFVNEWNDLYSPQKKILSSPNKPCTEHRYIPESYNFYQIGLDRGAVTSKTDTDARRYKKIFQATKHRIAENFVVELDFKITGGRIAEMSKDTGGVKLIWSRKLSSTAGRAHWRRTIPKIEKEQAYTGKADQHHVSIELAEKVINDQSRLKNVIAHEFCHLANFMISHVTDNPHGKSFKEWARRCSDAFAEQGIEVTTRHSYDIDYKYVWRCLSCNMLYKRHSKSIDPAKQACGSCTSKLIQIKPVPRIHNQTAYQLFIKSHFQKVKLENPKASHGTVMQMLGSLYKEDQRNQVSAAPSPPAVELLSEKIQNLIFTGS